MYKSNLVQKALLVLSGTVVVLGVDLDAYGAGVGAAEVVGLHEVPVVCHVTVA